MILFTKQFKKSCRQDDVAAVKELVNTYISYKKCTLDHFQKCFLEENEEKMTPLMYACYSGSVEVTRFFTKNRANINLKGFLGRTALMYGCSGNLDLMKKDDPSPSFMFLVESARREEIVIDEKERARRFSKNAECVKILLEKGADVTLKTDYGSTPLMLACQSENMDCVKLLLRYGAKASISGINSKTAVSVSCQHKNPECLKILLSHGGNPNEILDKKYTPLMVAAENKSPECMKILISNGAEIDTKNEDGCTALIYATLSQTFESVEMLVKKGADVNVKDNEGCTPLLHICGILPYFKNPEDSLILNFLLENGAGVNVAKTTGFTGLMMAAFGKSNYDNIEVLLNHNANVHSRAKIGGSALLLACSQNQNFKSVEILLKNGANPNEIDLDGNPVLISVCQNLFSPEEYIGVLVRYGADINCKQVDTGFTPLMIACLRPKYKCIPALIQAGADPNAMFYVRPSDTKKSSHK